MRKIERTLENKIVNMEQRPASDNIAEFPYVDLRWIYLLVVAIFAYGIYFLAPERGIEVPLSVKIVYPLAFLLFISAWRKAGKNVFALREDHIELHEDTKIPYRKITKAKITRSKAQITHVDKSGKEQVHTVIFGNIRISMKDAARTTLRNRLSQHGINVDLS